MKRAFFAVLTILLAMLAVTCDHAGAPAVESRYTSDGRPLVNLSIGASVVSSAPSASMVTAGGAEGPRYSLTRELAIAGVDYYEVAFKDQSTGEIYRTTFSTRGNISVPAGDYAGADNAVLFAGRYADRTLLAVGVLTAVDGSPGTTIMDTTKSVTFGLQALENDVGPSSTPAPAANSTFQITGPGTLPGNFLTVNRGIGRTVIYGADYPLFMVPRDTTGIEATYTLTVPNYIGVDIMAAGGTVSTFFEFPEPLPPGMDALIISNGTISPRNASLASLNWVFDITFDTSDTMNGLTRLFIEVPVNAISNANNPETWYIRGGLINQSPDAGKAANSVGGAVLIGVGNVNNIIIGTTAP